MGAGGSRGCWEGVLWVLGVPGVGGPVGAVGSPLGDPTGARGGVLWVTGGSPTGAVGAGRLGVSTAASTNAVSLCRAAGLCRVRRLERSRRLLLQVGTGGTGGDGRGRHWGYWGHRGGISCFGGPPVLGVPASWGSPRPRPSPSVPGGSRCPPVWGCPRRGSPPGQDGVTRGVRVPCVPPLPSSRDSHRRGQRDDWGGRCGTP